ncbi:alanine racemase [Candidatus Uhrbacteria bacterium]|nr:alanine racemase [Candidatus Uhrbacteria bacterium]
MKTWVEISRGALGENFETLRRIVGRKSLIMAAVKANAYGHGFEAVVPVLQRRVDWFAVDSVPEADIVARLAPAMPVLVLGYATDEELARAVKKGYRLTLYNAAAAKRLLRLGTPSRPARVHLKLETGTSRQGIFISDLAAFVKPLIGKRQIRIEGASTHFANVEDTADLSYARLQLRRFEQGMAILRRLGVEPPLPHAAASGAAMILPEARFGMVRTGIALYGLWPSATIRQDVEKLGHRLRPVLAWKCRVAQVKRLPKRTPVSYGLTERLRRDSLIAVLPVGYWDGLPRALSSVGEVLVRGHRAKIIGRICMNMCMIDVTDAGQVEAGDEVVLIGRQGSEEMSADEFAAKHGTIHYEAVTRINPTIPRIAVP